MGDDAVMFQVTEAMRERAAVDVPARLDAQGPVRAVAGPDGKGYSKYGIGLSLAALPFYEVGRRAEQAGVRLPETHDEEGNLRTGTRVAAVHLTNAAIGATTVLVLFLLVSSAGYGTAAAAGVAVALASATLFAHATTTFLSEPLSALTLTAALWAAFEAGRREGGRAAAWLALSGGAAGLAIATRASNLAPLVPLAIYVATQMRSRVGVGARAAGAAAWGLPAIAGGLLVAAYNQTRFDHPLATGYGAEASAFTTPLLEGLAGLLVSPGRGLIWYAPPVLLGLLGARALLRRAPGLALTAAGMVGALLLVAARYYQWHGGGVWGPRLLTPVLPLMLLPAAAVFERAASGQAAARLARPAIALCVGAGALGVALVVLVPFDRYVGPLWRPPVDLASPAIHRSLWEPGASPLLVHAKELPLAVQRTVRLVAGAEPLPGPTSKGEAGLPDLAFARYGSHALLQLLRVGALVLLGLTAGLAVSLRRAAGARPA